MKFLRMVDAKEYGNAVHLRILTRGTYKLFRDNFKSRSNVIKFGGWSVDKNDKNHALLRGKLNE